MGENELNILDVYRGRRKAVIMAANALRMRNKIMVNALA
jgi:hypothetical protein